VSIKPAAGQSPGWLAKLREDQRAAKAVLAVLVSQTLPHEIDMFGVMDQVWITSPKTLLPVAHTLRHTLIEIASVRQSSDGQQIKTEQLYRYLTGHCFRQRVEAILEAVASMQEDLNKEKRAITKQWAKREAHLHRVASAMAGMYGDLQGIAGQSMQEVDRTGFAALSAPMHDDERRSI